MIEDKDIEIKCLREALQAEQERLKIQDTYIKELLKGIEKLRQTALVDYVKYSEANNHINDNSEALSEKIKNAPTGVNTHGIDKLTEEDNTAL